jgi:hypothetical protein
MGFALDVLDECNRLGAHCSVRVKRVEWDETGAQLAAVIEVLCGLGRFPPLNGGLTIGGGEE